MAIKLLNTPLIAFVDLTWANKLRRILVAIAGAVVLMAGVALIVLPGPACIVIPAGLAILAIEFAWARRWLHTSQQWTSRSAAGMRKWIRGQGAGKQSGCSSGKGRFS